MSETPKTVEECEAELDRAIQDLTRRTKAGSTVNPVPYQEKVKAAALALAEARARE